MIVILNELQLRFSLSSLTSWRIIDGDFDTWSFYQNIVEYFDAPPGPLAKMRTQELLLGWDRKAFGYHREIPCAPEVVASLSVAQMVGQHTSAEVPSVPSHTNTTT
ncbi:hypothetical protein JVT61DRAFT_3660 [Boletus reticuloceps]|uniref:Uncharacterized protein n=1 Tax=Boletus reticuloceps TaxID=495285 RepID=A0A8I2YQ57_9AGAM|nr:hypothetical protein JVT61DRAFT_3660 [Boletus reticuloceps]